MSAFSYRELPSWLLNKEGALNVSVQPEYDANVMATRCGLDDRGEVAYLEDVQLVVRRAVPASWQDLSFFAIMAEPKDKTLSKSLEGTDLVMATWPVSRGWYDYGKFQFGTKHRLRDPGPEVMEALRNQSGAKRALLQSLGKNPFDSRHEVATAVLCDPFPLDPMKKFILGRQFYYKSAGDGPQSLLAICHDYLDLRKHLLGDPLLRQMLEATTTTRDLLPRYHGQWLASISSKSDGNWHPGRESAQYMLFDEIASEQLAWKIMETSVDLALAGPEHFENFRENRDSEQACDGRKLAKHRARDIYLQFYCNLWKRAYRTRYGTKPHFQGNSGKPAASQENEFWRAVREFAAELDLPPEKLDTVATTLLNDFIGNDGIPGLLHGPHHQQDPEEQEILLQDKGEILLFLVRAAALLKVGYRSKLLQASLEDLAESESREFSTVLGWIKKAFPLE